MKNIVINNLLKFILANKTYSELEIEKIKYGLEGLYLTITKSIIILALALILRIVKETILLVIVFNVIRYFGFGIHAKSSKQCLILSIILFIVVPYLFFIYDLNLTVEILIIAFSLINILIFAPSDSENRRFKNKNKYLIRKIITLLIAVIYSFLYFYIKSDLGKLFLISLVIQSIVINPLTYRLMKIKYNYKMLGLNRNI